MNGKQRIRNLTLTWIVLLGLACSALPAWAGQTIILLDVSDTAPLVQAAPFRQQAAQWIEHELAQTPLGTHVLITTLGAFSPDRHTFRLAVRLTKKKGTTPKQVGASVAKLILNIPALLGKGVLKNHRETSIIGALTLAMQQIRGTPVSTAATTGKKIIVLSDLLEYSAEANAYTLLKKRQRALPRPAPGAFADISVVTIGAGFGLHTSQANVRLETLWRDFFTRGNAAAFHYFTYPPVQ